MVVVIDVSYAFSPANKFGGFEFGVLHLPPLIPLTPDREHLTSYESASV